MRAHWVFCLLAILLAYRAQGNPIDRKAKVATEFIILHNNDMHARFEQTNVNSGTCSQEDANTDKCYGGFARVAYEVRKYRQEAADGGTPVFYLNAGDTYTGTAWFTIFKDKIASAFLNKLQPDVISLGNHEFDEKVEGLIPFLNEVNFPVVACNLDLKNVPELAATKNLVHSTILETQGTKIGVIGYLTPDTKRLTVMMDVEFYEEVVSINAEAKKLKAQGIKIIIALGHSGYLKDQEIAKNCPEVDIFDAEGNLIEFDGAPILLNASVAQEQDLLDLLEVYRPSVINLEKAVVGHSKVHLEGSKQVCRDRECNLGNMLTDAMVFSRVREEQGGDYWTDAAIAIMNAGGIRSSIEKKFDGSITDSDILAVLPWENDLYISRLSGKTIRNALEHGAAARGKDSDGPFLQVSGIHVAYDPSKPEGQRVLSVQVRCAACRIPTYSDLDDAAFYNVIVQEFMFDGGDGYVLKEANNTQHQRLQKKDSEAVKQYLQERQYIYPEVEGRIIFKGRC
ncbi:GL18478 [Drosophila persimilis]|uniref:5'-nucleotidase n=1 Tax=Drosophila persimilis TaxID=7234 RepID=B4G7P8_DROPE|nr:GL18478 [Drosophila persimilis]